MNLLSIETLNIARVFIGAKEATGNNDGPFCEMLDNFMDSRLGWMRGQPWCAAFACFCISLASAKIGTQPRLPRFAGTSMFFDWYLKNDLLLAKPEPYCLGMLKGGEGYPEKTHHHTFLVESIDGDFVKTIDGNWNDSVLETRHPIADCDFGPIV